MMSCACTLASIRTLTPLPHGCDVLCIYFRSSGNAKLMLHDYKGALADFDRADRIQPNNADTLQ